MSESDGGAEASSIVVGGGGADHRDPQRLLFALANRHGLIAGATGTGKTVTLQILAEGFSDAGVATVLADVKGDLAGLAMPGSEGHPLHAKLSERAAVIGVDLAYRARPVQLWDLFGVEGLPIRATVSEMGPLLLARLMDLSEAQEGVLAIAFRVADEQGLPLLDLADLQAMLVWVGENAKELSLRYGNVSTASVGSIQRQLLVLEGQGGAEFFGEPALDLMDLMRTDSEGRGVVNVLSAGRLMQSPRLYGTFLLWLLSELFERLPEVGNPDKPKLVFFFDEAHLLFDDAPKALVATIEQVARLIRSKGVGVVFVTQNPADVPESVLAQLGNRVQHALRVFTPKDAKDLQKAAETYRANPAFDTAEAITQVGTGEAVTSFLDAKGVPGVVERTLVRPPSTRLGVLTAEERAALIAGSPLRVRYETRVDRDSAREMLQRRMAETAAEDGAAEPDDGLSHARRYDPKRPREEPRAWRGQDEQSWGEAIGGVVLKELKGTTGRRIVRTIFGTLLRGR